MPSDAMHSPRSGVCRKCLTAFQLPLMTCQCGQCLPSTPPSTLTPAVSDGNEVGTDSDAPADCLMFDAMVQHSVDSGLPATDQPGKVRLQLVAQAEGAALLFTVEHSDGTKLGAFVPASGCAAVVRAFDNVGAQAVALDASIRGPKT